MDAQRSNLRRQGLGLFFWLLFAAGLLVQVVVPRMEISNGAFVIPLEPTASGSAIHPDEMVAEQRRAQLLSAALTICGALGLAFHYRDALMSRGSRRKSETVEGSAAGDAEGSLHRRTGASSSSDTRRQ